MNRRALITGAHGQDSQYLAQHLLQQGYEVTGTSRSAEVGSPEFPIVVSSLLDVPQLIGLLREVQPTEIYHLSAMSFIPACDLQPTAAYYANTISTLNLLEAIRLVDSSIRFFLASSCAVFGNPGESPQKESTPIAPRQQYGMTKASAQQLVCCYRDAYQLYAVSGIMYNHESPLRSPHFLSRRVTRAVAQIQLGKRTELQLGNLDTGRDWGFAGDYAIAMHKMLQLDQPIDLVLGTGKFHTVAEVVATAFSLAGLNWQDHVLPHPDPAVWRPESGLPLVADSRLAEKVLGWKPKVAFSELLQMMIDADLELDGS